MIAPLTPADCDLRDFPRMMIDVPRLRGSDFDATPDDSAWRAGVNLWLSAWHSIPAGSLSDDDAALAKAAGLGRDLRTWKKVRTAALRGFVLCSDGRLYHETVCEFALEAWIEKLVQRLSSGAGNAKRWGAEFDPAPIEGAIDAAVDLLIALAPASKSIPKAKRRHSRKPPIDIPPGSEGGPAGTENGSHPDGKNIPSGSQEKGTGTKEEEEEGSGTVVPGADAAPDPPIDPVKVMFDAGIRLLGEAGMPAAKARSILGKWRRDHGEEAVIAALGKAQRHGAIEPVSFIEGSFRNGGPNGQGTFTTRRPAPGEDIAAAMREIGAR